MNTGEYGISHNLFVGYNLSGFTSLELSFTRPDGTTFTRTNPDVTAPAVPLVTEDFGTFPANQYSTYIFKSGDMNQPGPYSVRLAYTDSTKHLISDIVAFEVKP